MRRAGLTGPRWQDRGFQAERRRYPRRMGAAEETTGSPRPYQVTLHDPDGRQYVIQLPDPGTVSVGELLAGVVEEVLPSWSGASRRFRLESRAVGLLLDPLQTLAAAGIPDGDDVYLRIEASAGGGGPEDGPVWGSFVLKAVGPGLNGHEASDAVKAMLTRLRTKPQGALPHGPLGEPHEVPDTVRLYAVAAVLARCGALDWPVPAADALTLVSVQTGRGPSSDVYQLVFESEADDLFAKVVVMTSQMKDFGAAVTLQRVCTPFTDQ